ncbi:MAG TPA: hypothetical protein VEQ60_20925 [Longimicrobium sp.]|nr:hypothetical protein [Longimicrobium sp.]
MNYPDPKRVPTRGVAYLKEEPLFDAVRDSAEKVGGVEKLFSKRAMKYRQMGLHEHGAGGRDGEADVGGVHLRHPPRHRPRRPRHGGILREAGG